MKVRICVLIDIGKCERQVLTRALEEGCLFGRLAILFVNLMDLSIG